MTLSVILIIFCLLFLCIEKKIVNKAIVIEGVIIGVVSGLILSFITDGNFRASMIGPVVKIAKKVNINLRYVSKNWTNIKVSEPENGIFDVSAVNTVSGSTVKFTNTAINKLPADLRYDVLSSDSGVIRGK